MKPGTSIVGLTVALAFALLAGCAAVPRDGTIRYVGSSTIGKFITDAEASYGRSRFALWTEPESYGGEQAALKGIADIADLLGEVGRERRRFGEDLMRLFEVRWQEEGQAPLTAAPMRCARLRMSGGRSG